METLFCFLDGMVQLLNILRRFWLVWWFWIFPRPVWFGEKHLYQGTVHHWAVRIGDVDWYELDGTGKTDGGPNTINNGVLGPYLHASRSRNGAICIQNAPVGYTSKTDEEIEDFNQKYLKMTSKLYIP